MARERYRWLAIAAVLALLLLAVGIVVAPPSEPEPEPATATRPKPAHHRAEAPPPPEDAAEPQQDVAAPVPPVVGHEQQDLEWLHRGADAPPCGDPARPPSAIPVGADCREGATAIVCAAPLAPGTSIPTVAQVEGGLELAATVVGRPRGTPLYVMVHDESSWSELAAEKRFPEGIVGLYDGTVHLSPQSDPDQRSETLEHELFHAVLDSTIQCVPRSVHEGLASWFAAEYRKGAWARVLKEGFHAPGALDMLVGPRSDAAVRASAYAEAEARVSLAAETGGIAAVTGWIGWLAQADRSDAAEAWEGLDPASDEELEGHVAWLLYGTSDPEQVRSLSEAAAAGSLVCGDEVRRAYGPPYRECHAD